MKTENKKTEKKTKGIIEPNFDYSQYHVAIVYVLFGLAILGAWKLVEIIRSVI